MAEMWAPTASLGFGLLVLPHDDGEIMDYSCRTRGVCMYLGWPGNRTDSWPEQVVVLPIAVLLTGAGTKGPSWCRGIHVHGQPSATNVWAPMART